MYVFYVGRSKSLLGWKKKIIIKKLTRKTMAKRVRVDDVSCTGIIGGHAGIGLL